MQMVAKDMLFAGFMHHDGYGGCGLTALGKAVPVGREYDAVGIDAVEDELLFYFFGARLREVVAEGVVVAVDMDYDFHSGVRIGIEELCQMLDFNVGIGVQCRAVVFEGYAV